MRAIPLPRAAAKGSDMRGTITSRSCESTASYIQSRVAAPLAGPGCLGRRQFQPRRRRERLEPQTPVQHLVNESVPDVISGPGPVRLPIPALGRPAGGP